MRKIRQGSDSPTDFLRGERGSTEFSFRIAFAFLATLLMLDTPSAGIAQGTGDTPAAAPSYDLPAINVVGVLPAPGSGIPLNQVPSNVQTLSAKQIENDPTHSQSLPDVMNSYLGSVSLSDTEGNPFQQDLTFRGYTSSPVLGTPQGLAVYQDGVRINEPFGDMVLWDLVPTFAIDKLQIMPGSNPLFGLNALGGAISLTMKNGFDFQGLQLDSSGGSFGREQVIAQYGYSTGDVASYSGFLESYDGGWRQYSASRLIQGFTDLSVKKDNYDLGINLTFADSHLAGNGADPVQELAADREGAYAIPDLAHDQLIFLQGHGNYQVTSDLSLQGTAYVRHSEIQTLNGEASGFAACNQPGDNPNDLCNNPGPGETVVTNLAGKPILASIGGTGTIGVQTTVSDALGASLQARLDRPLFFDMGNVAIAGASFDYAFTRFNNETQLGNLIYLNPAGTTTTPDGVLLGTSEFNTRLNALNRYYGLYGTDTLSVTSALSATASGRLNVAQEVLADQFGASLNGNHSYVHFNPAVGLTYQVNKDLNVYSSFGVSNRIPTPAELSCANATEPCRFPLGFVSDPGLRQVVAQTVEIGARGQSTRMVAGHDLSLSWSADIYGAQNQNDIIFVSSGPLLGSGYFANVGPTQRLGAEANLNGQWNKFDFRLSYGYVRATFQSQFAISSPYNPGANANGNITVEPGDRMPDIPLHSAKLGIGYHFSDSWSVELESVVASSQYLRGDEANLQPPLPGYIVFNAETNYRITKNLELYADIDNLLDRKYATFGVYSDPTGNGAFKYTDPRFYTPTEPFGFWVGLRAMF
jgi:iron complex outermembrane recepter protein